MIRAVIFDCFGVLYIDSGLAFYEQNVPNFSQLRTAIFEIDKQYDYGLISSEDRDKAIAELTGLDYNFIHKNIQATQVLNQALLDVSQSLRPRYKIGMISNTGKGGMDPFFSSEERTRLFDVTVLSSDYGVIKPNQEIFHIASEQLAVKPEECIFIDDRKSNCEGAALVGMQTILHTTNTETIEKLFNMLGERHA